MAKHDPRAELRAVNRRRLRLALSLLEQMVVDALAANDHGAVGVRIPVHGGRLGQVRRMYEKNVVDPDDHDD